MNTSTGNGLPVRPSYMTSLPEYLKPAASIACRTSSIFSPTNADPSNCDPRSAAALPVIDSMNMPTVILEGNAWGLISTSGVTPSAVYGRSSFLASMPRTPFCPCRAANLSPISGTRMSLTRILYILPPSLDCVMTTVSTMPVSDGLTDTDVSRRYGPAWSYSRNSSRKRGGLVLPMSMSPPETEASADTAPSSSSRRYDLSLL